MKIDSLENINTMFSIFHDGEIVRCVTNNNELIMDVKIKYLAERINPKYESLYIVLENIEEISFTTWPNNAELEEEIITDVRKIFKPELVILSSDIIGNLISVACSQSSHEFEYCGGNLSLKAKSAKVKDESEKTYSLNELNTLSNEYWEEWSKKNKA
jgi:hypothetical protein